MKYTGNYNLRMPEGTDLVNIDDINSNTDNIDKQLKLNNTKIDQIYLELDEKISRKISNIISSKENSYVLPNDSVTVPIGIPGYNESKDTLLVFKNSTFLKNGVDYNISTDSLNITAVSGIWKATDIFDFVMLGAVEGNPDVMAVSCSSSVYIAASAGITNIPINIAGYTPTTDFIEVYQDNLLLYETENYTMAADKMSINLVEYSLAAGEKLLFRLWKKVKTNIDFSDGSLIADASISKRKLSLEVINDLNKSGDLSMLQTTNKTDLVTAINELFQNANNGKTLISNVVGSPLLATDTFQQQKDKIQTLKSNLSTYLNYKGQSSVNTDTLSNLINKVASIRDLKSSASSARSLIENGRNYITVTGLGFTPKIVIIYQSGSEISLWGVYCDYIGSNKREFLEGGTGRFTDFDVVEYVKYGGFKLKLTNGASGYDVNWIAFGA